MESRHIAQMQVPASACIFWKFSGFAKFVGIPARLLLKDVESGRIPVRIERFGDRQLPYVRRDDALAYLSTISGN